MSKRRTLFKGTLEEKLEFYSRKDSTAGCWIWRNKGWPIDSVRVYRASTGLCYADAKGDVCAVTDLREDYPAGGKWQGPITWEE